MEKTIRHPHLPTKVPSLMMLVKKHIQQVVGSFLYYARAGDPTILMALSDIATQQSVPTENTKKWVDQFLDYMWTHPDATIWYHASDMILNVPSDALYLSAPRARSRAGGYFFLGSIPVDGDPIKLNGTFHITCQTSCCIRHWSQTGSPLPQCPRSQSPSAYPEQAWASTTANTNTHWQCYYRWHCQ